MYGSGQPYWWVTNGLGSRIWEILRVWAQGSELHIHRVDQKRMHTPYITVYSVISLPKLPYIHNTYGFVQPYTFDAIKAHNITVYTPYIYIYGSGQPYTYVMCKHKPVIEDTQIRCGCRAYIWGCLTLSWLESFLGGMQLLKHECQYKRLCYYCACAKLSSSLWLSSQ